MKYCLVFSIEYILWDYNETVYLFSDLIMLSFIWLCNRYFLTFISPQMCFAMFILFHLLGIPEMANDWLNKVFYSILVFENVYTRSDRKVRFFFWYREKYGF